jgi:hypothetical protein
MLLAVSVHTGLAPELIALIPGSSTRILMPSTRQIALHRIVEPSVSVENVYATLHPSGPIRGQKGAIAMFQNAETYRELRPTI